MVVLAAGLSGLAQAMYLASDAAPASEPVPADGEPAGPVFVASAVLRFGVGAWPAIAAAIVAHLLYLLATHTDTDATPRPNAEPEPAPAAGVQPEPYSPPVQAAHAAVQSAAVQSAPGVQPGTLAAVQRPAGIARPAERPALAPAPAEQHAARSGGSPARDRARAAATRHAHRHGALPTVSELEAAAEVSRGTAATVLKTLRDQPTPLHLITTSTDETQEQDDPSIEEHAQP